MSVKNGFDSQDIVDITKRVMDAKPYSLKKADYQEIAKSLAVGSVEVVKGAVCVAAVAAAVSIDLSESNEESRLNEEDGYRSGDLGVGLYSGDFFFGGDTAFGDDG